MIIVPGGDGLFLTPLPEPPGDPGALTAAAGTYTAAHGGIARSQAALRGAAGQATATAWSGVGAAAFTAVGNDLTASYALTAGALAKGAVALRSYAAALTVAKETTARANAAIATTNATASALLDAQATAAASQAAAQEASQNASTASAHAAANPHSPAAASAADTAGRTATDAQNTATSDANNASALSAQYDTDRAQALSLSALASQQAATAASRAAAGFDDATAGLLGRSPAPARGGAHGVPGGSAWDSLVEDIERTHTGMGGTGADGLLWFLGKGAGQAEEFMKGLPKEETGWLHEMLPWGQDAPEEVWQNAVSRWWNKSDAAEAFGQQFVDNTKWLGLASRIGRVGGGPIAVAGDISTMINPPQAGVMGNIDRVVAGGNAGLVGADTVGAVGELAGIEGLAAVSLPPVGVALAVGTGLFLAGAYAYKHWAWFRDDLANPVGHAIADTAKSAYHGLAHLGEEAWHDLL